MSPTCIVHKNEIDFHLTPNLHEPLFASKQRNGLPSIIAVYRPERSDCLGTTHRDANQSQYNTNCTKYKYSPESYMLHTISLVLPHLIPSARFLVVHIEFDFSEPWAEARELIERPHGLVFTCQGWIGTENVFHMPT